MSSEQLRVLGAGLTRLFSGEDVSVSTTGVAWDARAVGARLDVASATHPGRRRELNEDAVLLAPPVFVVADGMGGHTRGDVASRLVVEAFAPLGEQVVAAPDLEAAIARAQAGVAALALEFSSAPGSTMVAAAHVLEDGRGYWLLASIGDSRAYSFVDGRLEQLSKDHSLVQELIDAGELTRDEALAHPERHVVTRAIGGLADADADFSLVPAEPGSRLLLCSDGLTGELSDTAIGHILGEWTPAATAVLTLVDAAVAAGGGDNVSAVVVDVLEADPAPSPEVPAAGTAPRGRIASLRARLGGNPPLEDTRPSGDGAGAAGEEAP